MKVFFNQTKSLSVILLAVLISLCAAVTSHAEEPSEQKQEEHHPEQLRGNFLVVDIGIIGVASDDILQSALRQANEANHQGIILRINTPGGSLESTREMVRLIMNSDIPVIAWIGPSGSRAGSAGAFITLAAHLAAMAPGTNIGAAHPVMVSGEIKDEQVNDKITNDTIAFIESIAKERGKNTEMARSFVETSVSITDKEALDHNIIDLQAGHLNDLLQALDQREVKLTKDRFVQLQTQHAQLVEYEPTFRQTLLEILSNPNLFYLLFMAGLIGLGYELTHPGVLFPGIAGGICLILALIAGSVLPISFGAMALILVGIGLLVAEAFVPSFGILGVGGFVALVFGSIFLVDPSDSQGLRISWYVIAPGVLTIGGAFLLLGYLVFRAEKAPVQSGREGMIGLTGRAIRSFHDGKGQVRVAGAIWQAVSSGEEQVNEDDSVEVVAIKDLVLTIKKL